MAEETVLLVGYKSKKGLAVTERRTRVHTVMLARDIFFSLRGLNGFVSHAHKLSLVVRWSMLLRARLSTQTQDQDKFFAVVKSRTSARSNSEMFTSNRC